MNKIKAFITSLKSKKNYLSQVAISVCIILILMGIFVGYYTFNDKGLIKEAVNKTHLPELVSVKQNGYTFTVNYMSIDEDRMILNGNVSSLKKGDKFDVDMSFNNLGSRYNLNGNLENSKFTFKIEYIFVDGELREALKKESQNIIIDALIFKSPAQNKKEKGNSFFAEKDIPKYTNFDPNNDEIIQEIKGIKIPVKSIKQSQVISLDKSISLDEESNSSSMKLNSLVISPNKMRLNYESDYTIMNSYITDESGRIYKEVSGPRLSKKENNAFFEPSIYFDTNIKRLYLHFDCVRTVDGKFVYNSDSEGGILIYSK